MLGKLLKYEFKAVGRILIPLFLAVLVMTFISVLCVNMGMGRIIINADESLVGAATLMLFIILFFVIMAAAVVLSFIMSILRFKNNLLDKEGYLMNTLPVSANKHIFSKLTAAVIFQILSIIIVIAAYAIIIFTQADINYGLLFSEIGEHFETVYFIESCLITIIAFAKYNLKIYSCLAVGFSANSKRVLKSIGVFIVFYIIETIINSFLLSRLILNGFIQLSDNGYILAVGAVGAVYAFIYWLITGYFLKNRLNLQ